MNTSRNRTPKLVEPGIGSVKRLTYNVVTGKHQAPCSSEKFIKGPIPLAWISQANALPGKTGPVALALWFLVGIQRSHIVRLTGEVERIAGCGRKAVYAALRNLGDAGLISVAVKRGGRPHVEILHGEPRPNCVMMQPVANLLRTATIATTGLAGSGIDVARCDEMPDFADGEQK